MRDRLIGAIEILREEGLTAREIAVRLNDGGFTTQSGKRWNCSLVSAFVSNNDFRKRDLLWKRKRSGLRYS